MISSIPVNCLECGAAFGRMVAVNGQVRLDAGGWLIAEGMRFCSRCGKPFHFKPPKSSWEEVVQRYEKRVPAAPLRLPPSAQNADRGSEGVSNVGRE